MTDRSSDINPKRVGKIDIDQGRLTLPFSQDQFQEFISGLFGKQEQVQRFIEGDFDIEIGDIRDLHYLIEERIAQQNKGVLIQFSAKVFYDDDSSTLFGSLESLSNYSEPRAVIPIRVELSWQYLIRFQDRNVPEKQEIDIYVIARDLREYKRAEGYINKYLYLRQPDSGFDLKIKYTARTWATDLELKLSEQLKNLIKLSSQKSRLGLLINGHESDVGVISAILFFLLSIMGGLTATNRFLSTRLNSATTIIQENSDLNNKIDLLTYYIAGENTSRFYFFLAFFLLVMLVASIIIGIFITEKVTPQHWRSHILFTKKAQRIKEQNLKKDRNQLRNLAASIVIGICINLFSSYCFMLLTVR